jgi:glycosyltransferase involved in cell wall biosynthesis
MTELVMNQKLNQDLISVCVCTYKRTALLQRALTEIAKQRVPDDMDFEVIVVDNDHRQSAKSVVGILQRNVGCKIEYICEPKKNIALARNRSIGNAKGRFIAFIDDDEFPENNWLANMLKACKTFSADGVLGPVIPYYSNKAPAWLIKSGLCNRKTFWTGTVLKDSRNMRSGNLFLNRGNFDTDGEFFNKRYGKTGGEDTDFFERMLKKKYKFVWCDEARVYEEVPIERQKIMYHIRRGLIRGSNRAGMESMVSVGTLKSIAALGTYSPLLLILLFVSHHNFIIFLVKYCDHIGKLLGHCGLRLLRE